jgi:hypothetical protein
MSLYDDLQREKRRRAYADDPWLWIREAVWTIDEVDKVQPIKRFPVAVCAGCPRYVGGGEVRYEGPNTFAGGQCRECDGPLQELSYLRLITRVWQAAGHGGRVPAPCAADLPAVGFDDVPAILAVPKPRRMRLSWLMASLHTHLVLFTPHAVAFLVSSKEGKSSELLDRAEGILTRMTPDAMTPCTKVKEFSAVEGWVPEFKRRDAPAPELEFPNGSHLFGVPEGADQLRQFTATAVLADEIGTWKWPRESYTAFKPCIEGGGQITLISSAFPGFWGSLVEGGLTA